MIRIITLLIFCFCFNKSAQSQLSTIEILEKAKKSIVNIQALEFKESPLNSSDNTNTNKILFTEKTGAGIIIHESGLIITNIHILKDAQRFLISLITGETLPATLIKLMPEFDLALLKIQPPHPITPIILSNSNNIKLGDRAFNIGNSNLIKDRLTEAKIISIGFNQNRDDQSTDFFRVNIELYGGDSGGPLLNDQGELVGIIMAKDTARYKRAYAVASNKIRQLYLEYIP